MWIISLTFNNADLSNLYGISQLLKFILNFCNESQTFTQHEIKDIKINLFLYACPPKITTGTKYVFDALSKMYECSKHHERSS